MRKVHILVEGQTEEKFVKQTLMGHLQGFEIWANPIIATTKRNPSGPDYKGGLRKWEKVRKEILRLLADSSASAVSTMFDFYGLPKSFPGREVPEGRSPREKARYVEGEIGKDIDRAHRFIPYLQLHEFEAVLFSRPESIVIPFPEYKAKAGVFQSVRDGVQTPEEINDREETSPSHRIAAQIPEYKKVLHGPRIAHDIGLQTIRECPHFHEWVTRLESLGESGL